MVEIGYRQTQQDFAACFADSLSVLPVDTWWEDWMRQADHILDDPELVDIVYRAMLQRCPKSRTRGRLSTPAEVVLRLLVLKHLRNWSYVVLAREVRANLVYRQFTRIGLETVPHPKTISAVWHRLIEIGRAIAARSLPKSSGHAISGPEAANSPSLSAYAPRCFPSRSAAQMQRRAGNDRADRYRDDIDDKAQYSRIEDFVRGNSNHERGSQPDREYSELDSRRDPNQVPAAGVVGHGQPGGDPDARR